MRTQVGRRAIAHFPGARWTAVVLAALVMLGLTSSVSAQSGERIRSFDVTLIVGADGRLEVTEEITYDFGPNERRGILRDIPVRFHYDDVHDREYRLQVIDVSSSTAPDQYQREGLDGGYTRLRIGDPDRTITGAHTYVIRYRVEGPSTGSRSTTSSTGTRPGTSGGYPSTGRPWRCTCPSRYARASASRGRRAPARSATA